MRRRADYGKIPEHSALLVIDIQNDTESDAIPVMEGGTCLLNAPKVIQHFRKLQVPVIQIRELHRADHSDFGRELDGVEKVHCLEGTPAEEFHPSTARSKANTSLPSAATALFRDRP